MRWIVLTAAVAALVATGLEAQGRSDTADVWALLSGKYDGNGDGKITREEYPRGAGKFDAYDRDRDGAITRRDFTSGARRRPARARGGDSRSRIAAFLAAAADTNADGAVTAAERDAFSASLTAVDAQRVDDARLKEAVTRDLNGVRARMRVRMVRRALDADRDGVIRVEDLARLFSRLDRNRDGLIAKSEIPGRRRSARPPESQVPRRGDRAPDFELAYAGERKGKVRLSSFAGKKPVALIFGSYT